MLKCINYLHYDMVRGDFLNDCTEETPIILAIFLILVHNFVNSS